MGPVLYFRGVGDHRWRLSALLTTAGDTPPLLVADELRVEPHRLAERCGQALWRYDFSLPFGDGGTDQHYAIGDENWRVRVPAADGALRLAFTACNGSEQGNTWKSNEKRNACWLELADEHARNPFHLLLQGGDQLYADTVWHEVPALVEWRKEPWRKRRHMGFSPEMAEATGDYYFRRYCWLWAQPETASILAQVPSLMMWDDHDIFDGWGSYATGWEQCDVFQGIYAAAREHFSLFQLAAKPDDLPDGFSDPHGGQFGWAYRIGDIGILAPDLRS
ncbi:MAG TPA: alkaline phosphatase D family protein, partial [Pararhizobium sp.]|nr:alkaline phosphatase D family protein [Pararhizobium sp.]